MKISHFISNIDNNSGGPARSVTHLIRNLLKHDDLENIHLYTYVSDNPIISKFNSNKSKLYFLKRGTGIALKKRISSYDICHVQGIWELLNHKICLASRKNNIPYLISIRGMLEPWSLEQGYFKKKVALLFYQFKDLKGAICLHATANMEVESIRSLGLKNPIAMIPNGIEISKFPSILPKKDAKPRKLLFLSRIHKKKGIENLIEAWSNINKDIRKNWIIEIIGNGEINYIKELQKSIVLKNLEDSIFIKKPVFGDKKLEVFRRASLFVLPTFSENFGIVIAEALASYTPVITTKGTPWEVIESYKCGWWIDIGVKPLEVALTTALKMKEKDIFLMGENGRELIEKEFSMESVAAKMISLYKWILKKGEKPAFVNTYE